MITLPTQRLLLREWRDEDADALAAINADPNVMRLVGEGKPYDRATSDDALRKWQAHWDEFGYGLFAVTVADDDANVIGFTGVMQPFFMPEVMPSNEIGWRLASQQWGRGYATEAALACRDWALGTVGLDSLISLIRPENHPSIRVAEKLGLHIDRTMNHPVHGWPLLIYST